MRAAQREPLHAVGLAGGDGTVQHALAGLEPGLSPVPIGVLPVGSGNDFALHCGVPRSVEAALDALIHGEPHRVDLGELSSGRRFCCVAGVGLDELALRHVYASWLPRSKLLNIISALRALVAYRPRRVRITWEGGVFDGEVMFAAVTNTRSYGGGFMVAPGASVDDGCLDVCIVRRTRRLRLLTRFPRILSGTHTELEEVVMARSPWVRIESDAPLPVPLDGELELAQAPFEVKCARAAVQIMVPHAA
jgi:diacylglycerol kinase (ATP)